MSNFAYPIELQWWVFVGAALMIAWFTVGVQTTKAARINPSNCLKENDESLNVSMFEKVEVPRLI